MPDNGFDLSALRLFVETAKDCNMTRAAKVLGKSQPAISAAIKKMESSLGTPVFDRQTRPIQLTRAGRILQKYAINIIDELDYLTDNIQSALLGNKPDLRIGFSTCIASCVSPDLFPKLLDMTGNLFTSSGTTPQVTQMLRKNAVDIAIATDSLQGLENMQAIPIYEEDFLIVLPSKLTQGKIIRNLKEFCSVVEGLSYLRYSQETYDFVQAERIYRSFHFKDIRRIEVDNNISMLSLVSSGVGWTICPPLNILTVPNHSKDVDFIKFSLDAKRTYFVLYSDESFSQLANEVAGLCREIFQKEVLSQMREAHPGLTQFIHIL